MPKWGSGVLIPWARGKMLILRAGRGWSPECAPTPDYRHGCSGQKLLCVLGWRGEGAGGCLREEGGWWSTLRAKLGGGRGAPAGPQDTPQASQTTVPPSSAPLPHTRRALAEGLLGEVKRAVS